MTSALWVVQGLPRAPLSVDREHEAVLTACSTDGADAAAWSVRAIPRGGRSGWRNWPDPAWSPAHSTGLDTVGCLWTDNHHDWGDGGYAFERWGRDGTDASGGGTPRGVHRLRSPILVIGSLKRESAVSIRLGEDCPATARAYTTLLANETMSGIIPGRPPGIALVPLAVKAAHSTISVIRQQSLYTGRFFGNEGWRA